MSDASSLIPVFIPTLANMLAFAEQTKGAPLTAAEVEAVRDNSTCIMMESTDAQKLAQSRDYIDVNPENCWADWHRLRVQMTGKGYLPKMILCIPGGDDLRARCGPILEQEKVEHEFRPHDKNMLQAFKASSTTWPAFTAEDFARIDGHTTMLYLLSENFVAGAAPSVAKAFLSLGRRLLEAGGIAIKCESSGISHSIARWSRLDDSANRSPDDKWSALFHAYVAYPIGGNTEFYTCGMHLLGVPDLIVSRSIIETSVAVGASPASATIELFRIFGLYLVSECPVGKFVSGHTFSIDRDAPRYRIVWEPCTGFADDSFFFNPFGRWRFTSV